MTKKCYKCLIEKNKSDFSINSKRKDGLSSLCKVCHKEYYKNYYSNKKEKNRLYLSNKNIRERKRELISSYKDKPCKDCGIKYPSYVMDFDHLDREQKSFNISSSINKMSIQQIEEEILKCDVICANCHRIRTYQQSGIV